MGGGGEGPPFISPGICVSGGAGLDEELEIEAAYPPPGRRAVDGFMAPFIAIS